MKKSESTHPSREVTLDGDTVRLEEMVDYPQGERLLTKVDGVVIGTLESLDDAGRPIVSFPGAPAPCEHAARATVALTSDDLKRQVALMFEGGDPQRPILLGLIQDPIEGREQPRVEVEADDERLVFNAEREIVLRCGKASITLTRAGKIILRGAYLLSRSSGVNRIKGGSVQLN